MLAKSPIVLLVRHGRTSFNNSSSPRLRAWVDLSLSREGELDAQMAANMLRKYDPKMVYSSDLDRDRQTAEIIASMLGNISTDVDFALRTANVGDAEGQPEDEVHEVIERWYQEPWWQIPGGETNNDFLRRFYPAFDAKFNLAKEVEAMRPSVIVTHGRDIAAIHARAKMIPQWEALMTKPGGQAMVYLNDRGEQDLEFLGPTEPILNDV